MKSVYWVQQALFKILYAAAAKSLQSCPTLCDPRDSSPPGCPVPGILQARTLEWVAISFSNAWKWKVKAKSFSRVWLFATPWTAAYQAPSSMGFSRQEYWSGVPLPSPKILYRQDHNEISLHTCQNGYYQKHNKDQVLVRTWKKDVYYWWECKSVQPQLGISLKN